MTVKQHYIELYKIMILQIRRSVIRGGVVVNAKPIFLLALISSIRQGLPIPNVFMYDKNLSDTYYSIWERFYPNVNPTPVYKPYYHLSNDGFWSIKWKGNSRFSSSTDKKIRELVEYGYLDNALWDLLQDENVRTYFEEQIISFFLSDKSK